MSLIENMYIKKLVLVSNTMGNKSVIKDGVNGYVCETAEQYADRIRSAMKEFPKELLERAYQDVLEIYNTDVMKKKFVAYYKALPVLRGGYSGNVIILDFSRVAGVFCYATYGYSDDYPVEYSIDLHGYEVNDHGTVDHGIDGIDNVTTERLVAA